MVINQAHLLFPSVEHKNRGSNTGRSSDTGSDKHNRAICISHSAGPLWIGATLHAWSELAELLQAGLEQYQGCDTGGEPLQTSVVLSRCLLWGIGPLQGKLAMPSDSTPRFHRPRSVPYPMKAVVEEELAWLEREGVLEHADYSVTAEGGG